MRFLFFLCSIVLFSGLAPTPAADRPPNVIIIFADDLGYGDLSCYGSNRIRTPNLDRMAAEGLRFSNFYAFPSCSPSRASLMTGCYPPRVGIPDVVGPPGVAWTADKQYGLHPAETTLAEVLRDAGYATGMAGKWHLGHFAETMPTRQGFGRFFGLPYSNDMLPEKGYGDLKLYEGEQVVEANPDQTTLTSRYTARALDFVREHRDTSFFFYLAHSMPHVPLYASPDFAGRHPDDLYAGVIEEVDWSVGQVFEELDRLGIGDNTIVLFTSDNGPWLTYGDHAGSAGPFREGKGTTFEGGMRVPMLVRWPAGIDPGSVRNDPASLNDLLPTLTATAGTELPNRKIDGRDLNFSGPELPEAPFYYWRSGRVEAVRVGDWKLHVPHAYRTVSRIAFNGERGDYRQAEIGTSLYNVVTDPGEQYDRSTDYPEVVDRLFALARTMQEEMDAEKRAAWFP